MCIKPKAVRWILVWSLFINAGFFISVSASIYLMKNVMNLLQDVDLSVTHNKNISANSLMLLPFLLIPLSGWVGDVKYGRFKTIQGSVLLLTIMSLIPVAVSCTLFKHPVLLSGDGAKAVVLTILVCLVTIGIAGYTGFLANIIPFLMDQLRDAPAKESVLTIHWYVWITFVSYSISHLIFFAISEQGNFHRAPWTVVACLITLLSIALFISLLVTFIALMKKKRCFNTEPCKVNPYKLVYKVTKFACQHKLPINRSAFTYCEDELPSGLNLGKSKYGGPFTTEEVEDVKVFYEILKVLASFGPVLYMVVSCGGVDPTLASELSNDRPFNLWRFETASLLWDGLQDIVIIIAIPFYLVLSRCLKQCSLRALTKVEIATALMLLNTLLLLGVNTASHVKREDLGCVFSKDRDHSSVFKPLQIAVLLIIEEVISSFALLLIYVSFFEFICSQSPHSMRGMLIGLGYTILGIFNVLGLVLQFPFSYWKLSYPSCGFLYYSVNVLIGLASFILFICVAKRYKYRQRDEPSRERQFAEEYYSKRYSNVQQEPKLDYGLLYSS
jgi:peptide/histidine transporter 3/4